MFIDTGARLGEVASLRLNPQDDENNDIDLDQGLLRVLGEGWRWRLAPLGNKAAPARRQAGPAGDGRRPAGSPSPAPAG